MLFIEIYEKIKNIEILQGCKKMKQAKLPLLMCFMAFNAIVLQVQGTITPECLKAQNCTDDCYKVKICRSGSNTGGPGFVAGIGFYLCGSDPGLGSMEFYISDCDTVYVHKGWDVSYGVLNGGPWHTVKGGFPADHCIVVGCYNRATGGCTTTENVGERDFPGLNCSTNTPVEPGRGSR